MERQTKLVGITSACIDCVALGTIEGEKCLHLEVADIAGEPTHPKNVVCQPCIVNLKSGRPPYPFTKRTGKSMKSTVYPDHPRASASFAYRHLLH
jgi:hypothetical protein